MINFIVLKGCFSRLENIDSLSIPQRFTDRFTKLDYDFYIENQILYFSIGIFILEEASYHILIDLKSKCLTEYPSELFSDTELSIPKGWVLTLHPESEGRQIIHPKLASHLDWWSRYHDDDPEILAIVDEIISDIQAEEEAKNPKKDPFDDYWGL